MDDERKNHIDVLVAGSKVKVNFCTLCIRPCGHDSDESFAQSLSNSKGQGQLCPPPPFTLFYGYAIISQLSQVECTFSNIPTCEHLPFGGVFLEFIFSSETQTPSVRRT